jgi:tetratricopeptide (TPR) repeat protein
MKPIRNDGPHRLFRHAPALPPAAAAFLAVLACATAASAQDDAATAREQFGIGVELFRAENWAFALEAFQASFDARPNPAVRYNLGACLLNLGRLTEARTELSLYLAQTDPERISAERRAEVEGFLGEIDRRVALIDLHGAPAGAAVSVDGTPIGTAPLEFPVALEPGSHRIEITLDGYLPFDRTLTVEAGRRRSVLASMQRPAEDPDQPGGPDLPGGDATDPGSAFDDPSLAGIEPGTDEGLSPTWFWITAGLAGALAVGGAVTGGLVESKLSDYDGAVERCNGGDAAACDEGRTIASDGETLGLVTTVLFSAAGAAAAAALGLAFFTDWDGDESPDPAVSVGVAPLAGPPGTVPVGLFLDAVIRF